MIFLNNNFKVLNGTQDYRTVHILLNKLTKKFLMSAFEY